MIMKSELLIQLPLATCLPILNRDFQKPADGWYHIVPKGEFPHPVVGMQVVDDTALEAIVNRFNTEALQTNNVGLRIDFDHFSYDEEKSSEAAGWINKVENRADGIWAQVRWSDVGETAVTNGRFRLVSPVWMPGDLQKIGNRRVRPLRLDSVALTNNPRIKGMAPLSNRAGSADAGSAGSKPQQKQRSNKMQSVAKLLGLSADASEESVLEAVTKIKNRAETAEGQLEPIKNRVTTLETDNKALLEAQVESDLTNYGNRFKPAVRETWKAALLKNRAETVKLLEAMEPVQATPGKAVLNRADGKQPVQALNADDNARVDKAEAAIRQCAITNRCSYSEAREIVRSNNPELFGAAR
jgi:phage I-like protein